MNNTNMLMENQKSTDKEQSIKPKRNNPNSYIKRCKTDEAADILMAFCQQEAAYYLEKLNDKGLIPYFTDRMEESLADEFWAASEEWINEDFLANYAKDWLERRNSENSFMQRCSSCTNLDADMDDASAWRCDEYEKSCSEVNACQKHMHRALSKTKQHNFLNVADAIDSIFMISDCNLLAPSSCARLRGIAEDYVAYVSDCNEFQESLAQLISDIKTSADERIITLIQDAVDYIVKSAKPNPQH